ncbi:MAG TPA: polysaccharide biosynthesis/export family protein [Geobacteraceae bacterium]|nr:polysaccharide biosynthesis/export family protein [Geobacteraceae bacterium]
MSKFLVLFARFPAFATLVMLSGCAGYVDLAPGTVKKIECPPGSPVVERQQVSVTAAFPVEAPPSADYVIGLNDVLYININGKPEFLISGPNLNSKIQGSRVDGNGDVRIPLVGPVRVAGLTVSQAQERIQQSLVRYLKEPWVVVEVAEYKSHPLYLLGQFKAPGTYYMDRPLTLAQGIALGNGYDTSAYLKSARLVRDHQIMPVDVYDLLLNGNQTQNVWLRASDMIFIPDNTNQQVFVFGAVKKPGPVPMLQGGLNLAQAIGSAELRDTGYDFKHVRIIRSLSVTKGELLVVDFDKILRGQALPLPLMAGDIIYVPRSNIGAWNDALNEIIPSLQAISALLQPFVQIEYLKKSY